MTPHPHLAGYAIYPRFGFEIVDGRTGNYFESGEDGAIVMALKRAYGARVPPLLLRTTRFAKKFIDKT